MRLLGGFLLAAAVAALPSAARADTERDRAGAGGYFRIMTRPDLQGGNGRLGYSNLYGRLLNEGPWAALDLRLDLLQAPASSREVWSSVHAKIEGGSVKNADAGMGSLGQYRLTQLYVKAGNVLLEDVTWQLGTLESYLGELGLYDFRPAQVFEDTVGLSARWTYAPVELLVGVGDAGYSLRGAAYNTVLTGGGTIRVKLGDHVEVGGGGQGFHEPEVKGNPFAPHSTPGIDYEDFIRGEVVSRYREENPVGDFGLDHKPVSRGASSYKAIGYLGFGGFGPLTWNNLFLEYVKFHPEVSRLEGATTLYVTDFTDERTGLMVGNEAQLVLWPGRLDAAWAVLYLQQRDADNELKAGEDNRDVISTVLRLQLYATETLHLLCEGAVAREESLNGNLWREHVQSIFAGTDGQSDARGLEMGDTARRETFQLKVGPVLNPLGAGIFTRPSLRLLYGLQLSNVHAAFVTNRSQSLAESDLFPAGKDQHAHSVIALEAEAWF